MGQYRALGLAILLSLGAGWTRAAWNPETGNYVFQIYSAGTYKAHPQNWAAVQDSRGLMYFGNTEGLLEYDGVTWRTIQLPRSSPVRSLATDRQGNVYVGGSGELGFLQDDRTGGRTYVSLLDRIPQDARKFASVWRIFPAKDGVYFSSYQFLFLLQPDGKMRVFRPKKVFGQAFVFRDQLYVTTKEDGLQRLAFTSTDSSTSTHYAFEKVPGGERFLKEDAIAIVPDGASAVIASPSALFRLTSAGVTAFPTEADEYLQKNALYSMLRVPGDLIQIGTRRGGLVLLDAEGKLRRTITTHDGLPSNWVTAMGMDRQGSIWLTTDAGIVRFNPGLTRFGPSNGIEGKVLTIRRVGKDMYAGTTAGLFRMLPRENGAPEFEQVRGIETTQYTIVPSGSGAAGEEFLSGGLKGLWAVSHLKATNILNTDVIYDASASLRDPRVIYAAGRAGLFRLRRESSGWVQTAHVPSSGEEFRVVLEDQEGKVWATAPGVVLRMDLDKKPPVIERFEAPPGIRTSVYRLGGGLIFATSKGVMRFSGGKLVPDPTFGTRAVSLVTEDRSGDASSGDTNSVDTWVTGPGFHTVLRTRREGSEWYPEPLIEAGIEEIYTMALDRDHTCWAAGADSILHRWREPLAGDPNREFRVITRRVEPIGGKEPLRFPLQPIPHAENAIRFEFAAPFFESPGAVEYQVKLDGSDKEWSAWSPEAHKDYTNLFETTYRFHVRARNPHGHQTEEATVDFRVKPPWFRTWFAYFVYAVGLAVAVWGIIRWRVRKLEESNRRLEVIVDQRTAEVRQQRDQIAEEEKKTESLLLNILPAPVAAELRQTGSVTPMSFEDVTVCFTDFVGFTLSSEKLEAGRLVDALNEYFTCFDEIVGRYGLEKLKTIGDSYMFVSGLPEPRRSHAVDAVMAALEMVAAVKRIAARKGDVQWNIRIGLNSGPVVAGVVGVRKFAFDVWGDTVNFAARMESSGVPGKVNISSRTCRLLGGLIDCEGRGMIRIKEGREMEMFLVRGPASHLRSEEEFRQLYEDEFGEEFRGSTGFLQRESVSARTA